MLFFFRPIGATADLETCGKIRIWTPKSTWIQKRTDRPKFGVQNADLVVGTDIYQRHCTQKYNGFPELVVLRNGFIVCPQPEVLEQVVDPLQSFVVPEINIYYGVRYIF